MREREREGKSCYLFKNNLGEANFRSSACVSSQIINILWQNFVKIVVKIASHETDKSAYTHSLD
jgi:hypothetical protein